MTTHGYSGLRRWAVGSVTDKVIQRAVQPVFILPSGGDRLTPPDRLRRILVPLDGSDFARQALPVALDLATAAAAEVILLSAVEPPAQSPGALIVMRNEAAQELQRVAIGCAAQTAVRTEVVVGYPAEAIVDEAARIEADLIVMATHGRGGIRRWALGSIADKVLHATSTPLLLVRPAVD
jgi:nucleotide-binding universal stress UspA family protein